MSIVGSTRLGHLSRFDQVILSLHVLGALAMGINGFVTVDPDWAGLQMIVILMLVGLWLGGVLLMYALARRIASQWIRAVILLVGPFIGIAVLVGRSMLT